MGLAWGGYRNGNIPVSALHIVPNFSPLATGFASVAMGSLFMKTEAAYQLSGLMRAFWLEFGIRLLLSEGYRSEGVQDKYWDRYIYRKPGWTIAALPPTSIHGWGLSADLAVEGVGDPAGKYLAWLRANAHLYGFVNDVSKEPWHWSYRTDLITRTIVVHTYISDPEHKDESIPEVTPNTARKVLMAASDTLTYFQRKNSKGVKENKYFVAGPGIFADVVTLDKKNNEVKSPLMAKSGLSSSKIREVMNREKIEAVILDARDFDERRAFYASLAAINK